MFFGIEITTNKRLIARRDANIELGRGLGRSDVLNELPPPTPNYNLCDFCHTPTKSYKFADSGVCGKCGRTAHCFDYGLIELYETLGFDEDFVWRNLPRLRTHKFHGRFQQKSEMLKSELNKRNRAFLERENND